MVVLRGPFLSSSSARLGLGELRARGVELGAGKLAILHDDRRRRPSLSRLRRTAATMMASFGIGDQFDAIALERAGQGVFVVARAAGKQRRAASDA